MKKRISEFMDVYLKHTIPIFIWLNVFLIIIQIAYLFGNNFENSAVSHYYNTGDTKYLDIFRIFWNFCKYAAFPAAIISLVSMICYLFKISKTDNKSMKSYKITAFCFYTTAFIFLFSVIARIFYNMFFISLEFFRDMSFYIQFFYYCNLTVQISIIFLFISFTILAMNIKSRARLLCCNILQNC